MVSSPTIPVGGGQNFDVCREDGTIVIAGTSLSLIICILNVAYVSKTQPCLNLTNRYSSQTIQASNLDIPMSSSHHFHTHLTIVHYLDPFDDLTNFTLLILPPLLCHSHKVPLVHIVYLSFNVTSGWSFSHKVVT